MESNEPMVGMPVQYIDEDARTSAAIITHVHKDGMVNLAVFHDGSQRATPAENVQRDGVAPDQDACYKPLPLLSGEAPEQVSYEGSRVTTAFKLEYKAGDVDRDYLVGRAQAIQNALGRDTSKDVYVRKRFGIMEWDFGPDEAEDAREFALLGCSKIRDHKWAITDLATGATQRLGTEDELEGDVLDAAAERVKAKGAAKRAQPPTGDDGLPTDAAQDLVDAEEAEAAEDDATEAEIQRQTDKVGDALAAEADAWEEQERERAREAQAAAEDAEEVEEATETTNEA